MRIFLRDMKRDILLALRTLLGVGDTQSWKRFHKEVRSKGCSLLRKLGEFPDAVLVAGCQRSGTTILARVITQSEGMVNYRTRHDDELDAALILSGYENHVPRGRYCFQTTYLNECYREYFDDRYNFKLIWVLRNPLSVVCSMKYNWGGFAFNELFDACGYASMDDHDKERYRKYGHIAISRTRRACLSYNGKQLQAMDLMGVLGKERMMVVDYDQMVRNKEIVLNSVYQFINLKYHKAYESKINDKSLRKADKLSKLDKAEVEKLCMPSYERVKELVTQF